MEELAKRAVACKHWRWMPGMSDKQGFRFIGPLFEDRASADRALPDLSDPATLGCLLALVRDACGNPHLHVEFAHDLWFTCDGDVSIEETEAEALVSALEAAD